MGEVEIAHIDHASTTGNRISLYAHPDDNRTLYSVADEHEAEFQLAFTESRALLNLSEFVAFIDRSVYVDDPYPADCCKAIGTICTARASRSRRLLPSPPSSPITTRPSPIMRPLPRRGSSQTTARMQRPEKARHAGRNLSFDLQAHPPRGTSQSNERS